MAVLQMVPCGPEKGELASVLKLSYKPSSCAQIDWETAHSRPHLLDHELAISPSSLLLTGRAAAD